MTVMVQPPFITFKDVDGDPLESGYVYIGEYGLNPEVSPVSLYWDKDLSIPAAQPLRTLGGYASRGGTPSNIFISERRYSITVRDKNQQLVYSNLFYEEPIPYANISGNPFHIVADYAEFRQGFIDGDYAAGDIVFVTDIGIRGYFFVEAGSDDDGGIYISDGGSLQGTRFIDGAKRNVQWYGAGQGASDDTDAFNAALMADAVHSQTVQRISVYVAPGNYNVLGTVYVRKGQSLFGDGGASARLFMSTSGSIKMGERSDGVVDPGGAPPNVSDLFLEGGNRSIEVSVSGYSIRNIFSSFSTGGVRCGGSDGSISGCTFDDGSTLFVLTGGGHSVDNCLFYVGNTQFSISDSLNTTNITNCVFSFAQLAAVNMQSAIVKGVKFADCVFKLNEQFASFQAFIMTTAIVGESLNIDAEFHNCSFHNANGWCMDFSNGGNHDIRVIDCEFDGDKTSSGFVQSTTAQGIRMNAVDSKFSIFECEFKNLHDTPIVTAGPGSTAMDANIGNGTIFSNNGGTVDIDLTNTSEDSRTRLFDIIGSGRRLFNISGSNQNINLEISGLQDWFEVLNDAGANRDYIVIPYVGAGAWDVNFFVNPTTGAGDIRYRTVETYVMGVYYGSTPSDPSTHTKLVEVANFVDAGISVSDITVEFDSVGGGSVKSGIIGNNVGDLYISWDDTYYAAEINVQPRGMARNDS